MMLSIHQSPMTCRAHSFKSSKPSWAKPFGTRPTRVVCRAAGLEEIDPMTGACNTHIEALGYLDTASNCLGAQACPSPRLR